MTDTIEWIDTAPADLDGYTSDVILAGDVPTRFYDVGEGFPIVMVHGSGWRGGSSANTFVPVFAHLSQDYRLIVPDKLGSGLTGNPSDPAQYTCEAQVEHMADFIRALGLERFHLVGQSRGGYLAARLAVEYPELIESLVIVDSGTLGPDVGDIAARRRELFKGTGVDGTSMDDPVAVREATYNQTAVLSWDPTHITDEFLDAKMYMESTEKSRESVRIHDDEGGRETFLASLARQKPDTLEKLEAGAVSVPTLIYWGADDPSAILPVGLELFERVRKNNDRTRMVITNRAGHFHYREHPEEFSHTLRQFYEFWKDGGGSR